LTQLKEQQIGEGRLGPFDLGGKQGFTPHIGVEKQLGVREQGGDPVQPSAGQQRPLVQRLQWPRQLQRRIRRQWRRHEGPHCFTGGAGDLVAPGGIAPHGAPGANLEYRWILFKGKGFPLNKAGLALALAGMEAAVSLVSIAVSRSFLGSLVRWPCLVLIRG
jgi:hypothetical protein